MAQAGWDIVGTVATLCIEAQVSNLRGDASRRDGAVAAAAELMNGLGRCGSKAISVQPILLGRTTRQTDLS